MTSTSCFIRVLMPAVHLSQDFCRDRDPSLPSLSLKAFAGMIFRHCPGLAPLQNDKQAIFAQFSAYKQAVPVMGAILLNAAMDKCLLVRGFKEHASWGFPRGKLAKDETDVECAVREVNLSAECLAYTVCSLPCLMSHIVICSAFPLLHACCHSTHDATWACTYWCATCTVMLLMPI